MRLRPSLCSVLLLSCWLTSAQVDNERSPSTTSISPSATPYSIYSRAHANLKIRARDIAVNPPDGKDGKPHDGPFIETSADRDRKKAVSNNREQQSGPANELAAEEANFSDGKTLPKSNNGVMEDRMGLGPNDDTRGLEGGVSSKSRNKAGAQSNFPEQPKEAPPLPLTEEEKLRERGPRAGVANAPAGKGAVDSGNGPLKKPTDLPDSPHRGSPRVPADNTDPLAVPGLNLPRETLPVAGVSDELHSLFMSLTMIVFSEIGDKTFLVAALMAMRHSRTAVFSSAFSALFLMTVLSAVLGHAVPTLLPAKLTQFAASALFLVFGLKMLLEARTMSPDENASDEMKEVELELNEKESRSKYAKRDYMMESGRSNFSNGLISPVSSSSSRSSSPAQGTSLASFSEGMTNLCSFVFSPAWVQTFVMTFLAEWGDRSQIATIAMAAGDDYWLVIWGAVLGHGLCTGAAVLCGRFIAGRVSMRLVTLAGGGAFLVFSFIYLWEFLFT